MSNTNNNSNKHDGRLYRSVVDFDDEAELREALINPALWNRDDCGNDEFLADAADLLLDQNWDWTLKSHNTTNNTCAPPEWEEKSTPQSVEEEAKRLMNVKTFDMIGRVDDVSLKQTQASLDTLVNMAKRVFDVPIVQINLVDLGQVYSVSETGCNGVIEFERRYTFCSHTIQFKEDVMEVINATGDSRFCQNPHVTGDFHLRYYAGTQLISPEGYRIGTFCLVGCQPKDSPMTEEQKETLKDFSRLAVNALANRRDLAQARKSLHEVEKAIQGGAHDMDDLLTTTQYAIHKLKQQPKDGSQAQTTTSALNMVKEISRYTLNKVQEEAAKAHPDVFDHMTKKLLSKEGAPEADKEKTFNMNIDKCLSNLHSLVQPIPKPAPMVMACDPNLPSRLLISGTPQILIRACLNLLLFACRKNNRQHQQQPSPTIQFHVLRRDKHVVFECHHVKPAEGPETTAQIQRLFEIIARQGHASSQEGEVSNKDQSVLQYFGMWPLITHVKELSGLFGYSPTSPGDDQLCVSWFAIPLVESPPGPEQQQPPMMTQQVQQQYMQQQQPQHESQYQPQQQQSQYQQQQHQSFQQQPEITPAKYNIHALEEVLKTLQSMIQPIVRSAREGEQMQQQYQQPNPGAPPTLIEFTPSEKDLSRSNSQSTFGSAAHRYNGEENYRFNRTNSTNSHSTNGSRPSQQSATRPFSTTNYEYPQENKRFKLQANRFRDG